MGLLVRILILALAFSFGLLCILAPMAIARAIVWWTKLALRNPLFRGFNRNPKLEEALRLMESNPAQYEEAFYWQIARIRRIGWLAVVISLLGTCILAAAR
jgi:hypothetical protein